LENVITVLTTVHLATCKALHSS